MLRSKTLLSTKNLDTHELHSIRIRVFYSDTDADSTYRFGTYVNTNLMYLDSDYYIFLRYLYYRVGRLAMNGKVWSGNTACCVMMVFNSLQIGSYKRIIIYGLTKSGKTRYV